MSGWHTRAYRRVKIAPGIRLNLSKRGASLSLGPRGAHITVGTRGIRESVGIPGTGIGAYRQRSWQHHRRSSTTLPRIPTPRMPRPSTRTVSSTGSSENWFAEHSTSPGSLPVPAAVEPHGHSATGCLAVLGLFVGIVLGFTYVWPIGLLVLIGSIVLDLRVVRLRYHHQHPEPVDTHHTSEGPPTTTPRPPTPPPPAHGDPVTGWNAVPEHHQPNPGAGPVPGWNPHAGERPHGHSDTPSWGAQ